MEQKNLVERMKDYGKKVLIGTAIIGTLGALGYVRFGTYNKHYPTDFSQRHIVAHARFSDLKQLADVNRDGTLSPEEESEMYRRMGVSKREFESDMEKEPHRFGMIPNIEKAIQSYQRD
ncbi:MAG: hypothetical protein DRP02_12875 [Candidatus Gerdarchaeota archaeon]|nr:MAG: hypothetical protein DRP02_12875 [Candidatus Gerdarchaeota archaeon]